MGPRHLIALLFTVAGASAFYDCPFPECEGCLPASVHDAPGIGFGLSFSSGTAAAHLYNGTVIDIAHIVAAPIYTALMARLASAPEPPPLGNWERWRRSINKRLGRPATPDVGILTGMLIELREAVASALAPSPLPERVAVSHPPISGLAAWDLTDALEHAGLGSWFPSKWPVQAGLYPKRLTEAHAAFAARGLGLCADYKDLFECWEEEEQMPTHTALLAGLTRVDLRVEVVSLQAPFEGTQEVALNFADLGAGLDRLGEFASEEAFWEHVHGKLVRMAWRAPARLTLVMLAGENATHPRFLRTVRDALVESGYATGDHGETQDDGLLVLGDEHGITDPVFASARGAAQYARWRQEAPFGCREDSECEEQREKQRAEKGDTLHSTARPDRSELR
ncbi:hypothetical protein F4779DRAFT_58711 [Xylariaceae sp. FL0662B]|nr:hypothetical protein F4779DRAFT_58711 [Xylariaceae sp. FL0662B]